MNECSPSLVSVGGMCTKYWESFWQKLHMNAMGLRQLGQLMFS